MAELQARTADPEPPKAGILGRVVRQNSCPDCDGDLERKSYKGNPAAVCTDCGTPAVQLFEP